MAQANENFKATTSGAGAALLSQLGAALLALSAQRSGGETDSAPGLRQAALELQRHLLQHADAGLSAQAMLFLISGALADTVSLRDATGQIQEIQLLPSGLYALLLAECQVPMPQAGLAESLCFPQQRWTALSSGQLSAFNFNRPGRFKPHQDGQPRAQRQVAVLSEGPRPAGQLPEKLQQGMRELTAEILADQQDAGQALRRFAAAVSGERLADLIKQVTAVSQFVAQSLEQLQQPDQASSVVLPAPEQHPALSAIEALYGDLHGSLTHLSAVLGRQMQALDRLQQLSNQFGEAGRSSLLHAENGDQALPQLEAGHLKLIESDASSMFASVSQYLINHPQRTAYSASRVLLAEHFEKIGAAPEDCIATPPRLLAALQRAQALHPNCFPLDDRGEPVFPPVIVEPGVGLVKWLDDRFLLSFVAGDPPRNGPQLSLTPLDQAVLRIFGSFLARGDIWNYRGERLQDSMMAEYAGEIEQKVAVKFTGADKKLSYGTSAEEKDGASRDDAVRDYLDFVFCVFNGLQLPKRITARKAGVFLKYCVFRDLATTVNLTLHLIAGTDALAARAIILKHLPHDARQVITLCKQSLDSSPVLQTRYRRDLDALLNSVMGREFMDDARDAGLLGTGGKAVGAGGIAQGSAGESEEGGESVAPAQHDYFDL